MLASRLTAYFRRKCVAVTDRRVRLMNEILGCIKFIKMYCWEDAFSQNVHIIYLFHVSSTEVRSEERGILEKTGVVQSLTVGVAPIVVVIASVCTFTLHMALGYDLTAAERLFMMDDRERILAKTEDPRNAVEFLDATLAWEKARPPAIKSNPPPKKRSGIKRVLRREKLSLYISTDNNKANQDGPNGQSLLTNIEQESPQSTISSTQSIRPPLHKTLHRINLRIKRVTPQIHARVRGSCLNS
ncbi:hypothetical protein GOODEAATRI_013439 [Goodea atripinnis]|uniref:Uncharacterized protein n=1 Tax=Goodea atripinnis TaxID=208336 RepID=A0ABV0NAC7_9TELE